MLDASFRRRSSILSRVVLTYQFEGLEQRTMLCATPAEAIAAGVPESMIMDDGHIKYSDFVTLPPAIQAHLNPHMIQSELSEHPIDYDKLLGLPLYPDGPPANGSPALSDTLP